MSKHVTAISGTRAISGEVVRESSGFVTIRTSTGVDEVCPRAWLQTDSMAARPALGQLPDVPKTEGKSRGAHAVRCLKCGLSYESRREYAIHQRAHRHHHSEDTVDEYERGHIDEYERAVTRASELLKDPSNDRIASIFSTLRSEFPLLDASDVTDILADLVQPSVETKMSTEDFVPNVGKSFVVIEDRTYPSEFQFTTSTPKANVHVRAGTVGRVVAREGLDYQVEFKLPNDVRVRTWMDLDTLEAIAAVKAPIVESEKKTGDKVKFRNQNNEVETGEVLDLHPDGVYIVRTDDGREVEVEPEKLESSRKTEGNDRDDFFSDGQQSPDDDPDGATDNLKCDFCGKVYDYMKSDHTADTCKGFHKAWRQYRHDLLDQDLDLESKKTESTSDLLKILQDAVADGTIETMPDGDHLEQFSNAQAKDEVLSALTYYASPDAPGLDRLAELILGAAHSMSAPEQPAAGETVSDARTEETHPDSDREKGASEKIIETCPHCGSEISFPPNAGMTFCKGCDNPVADYEVVEAPEDKYGEARAPLVVRIPGSATASSTHCQTCSKAIPGGADTFYVKDRGTAAERAKRFCSSDCAKSYADYMQSAQEVAPPGWKGTTKAMKKHKDIDNPFALAWSMKDKGYRSHIKGEAKDSPIYGVGDTLRISPELEHPNAGDEGQVVKIVPDSGIGGAGVPGYMLRHPGGTEIFGQGELEPSDQDDLNSSERDDNTDFSLESKDSLLTQCPHCDEVEECAITNRSGNTVGLQCPNCGGEFKEGPSSSKRGKSPRAESHRGMLGGDPCPSCLGQGELAGDICPVCDGQKFIPDEDDAVSGIDTFSVTPYGASVRGRRPLGEGVRDMSDINCGHKVGDEVTFFPDYSKNETAKAVILSLEPISDNPMETGAVIRRMDSSDQTPIHVLACDLNRGWSESVTTDLTTGGGVSPQVGDTVTTNQTTGSVISVGDGSVRVSFKDALPQDFKISDFAYDGTGWILLREVQVKDPELSPNLGV